MTIDDIPRHLARRIVTGVDERGRSCVLSDGAPCAALEFPGVMRLTQIWRTVSAARSVPFGVETAEPQGPPTLDIGAEGTLFALLEIAPGDLAKSDRLDEILAMEGMDRARAHAVDKSNPVMHATDTIDFAILLEGELTLVLETGTTVLRAGDMLVQGGACHSWINHTDRPARMLGVLVGATRAAGC